MRAPPDQKQPRFEFEPDPKLEAFIKARGREGRGAGLPMALPACDDRDDDAWASRRRRRDRAPETAVPHPARRGDGCRVLLCERHIAHRHDGRCGHVGQMATSLVEPAMKGILSAAPATGPIRLLVGTQLMLLVLTILVLETPGALPLRIQGLLLAGWVLGVSALICAIRGDCTDERPWWRRRHDH